MNGEWRGKEQKDIISDNNDLSLLLSCSWFSQITGTNGGTKAENQNDGWFYHEPENIIRLQQSGSLSCSQCGSLSWINESRKHLEGKNRESHEEANSSPSVLEVHRQCFLLSFLSQESCHLSDWEGKEREIVMMIQLTHRPSSYLFLSHTHLSPRGRRKRRKT